MNIHLDEYLYNLMYFYEYFFIIQQRTFPMCIQRQDHWETNLLIIIIATVCDPARLPPMCPWDVGKLPLGLKALRHIVAGWWRDAFRSTFHFTALLDSSWPSSSRHCITPRQGTSVITSSQITSRPIHTIHTLTMIWFAQCVPSSVRFHPNITQIGNWQLAVRVHSLHSSHYSHSHCIVSWWTSGVK